MQIRDRPAPAVAPRLAQQGCPLKTPGRARVLDMPLAGRSCKIIAVGHGACVNARN